MLSFSEFLEKRRAGDQLSAGVTDETVKEMPPRSSIGASGTVANKRYNLPKIDSSDVIGSLSGMLGPSPEERAAEEERLQRHRRQMHRWTAAFNGLRHLGNLYYATKGAPGQKFSDPHQQIEQQYHDERKRLAEIQGRKQQYYANLWSLFRQMDADQRAKDMQKYTIELHNAQQAERQRQFDERQRQQEKQLEERQRQFEEKQRQQQEQFEARQKQQQEQFEARQKSKKSGGGGGRSAGSGTSETVEWVDNQGRKHRRTTKGGGSSSGVRKGNGGKIATGVNWK